MGLSPLLTSSLGLSQKEADTYLALLELGASTIKPIADRTGLKRTSIYNFIDDLVTRGILSQTVIRGRRYYEAVSPSRLVELAKIQAQKIEERLPDLLNLMNSTDQKIRVQYFEGPKQTRNIVREETKCHKLARYIWPGENTMEMVGGPTFMTEIDKTRIKEGVHIKAIRFKQQDSIFETSAHGKKFLREIRYAPSWFKRSIAMGIYDTGKVSFFSSKREGFGVLIESEELVELMTAFHDLLWKSSIPAQEGQG